MQGIRRINQNPAEQSVQNFLAASNAYADQQRQRGEAFEFLSAQNAPAVYQKLIKTAIALSDSTHPKHNEVFNSLTAQFGKNSEAVSYFRSVGESLQRDTAALASVYAKNGFAPERAVEAAFNSIAGNPVFDHFGNLNLLAGQLYQEQAFIEAFLSSGDAFAVPLEAGSTGLDTSRFRAPTEKVAGSAKILQGDINPHNSLRADANRTQLSLYNEFKNALTLGTTFSISQAQRDQTLGYEKAVSPALAGFILQNRYFGATQKQVMKLAEVLFVGGLNAAGTYTPNVGGSYGLLSSAIQLQLADWAANAPVAASSANWAANPTKLIQKIQNAIYKPAVVAAQLDPTIDSANMYKELVRLFQLPAQQNVDFTPKEWTLFVPSSWYGLAMQYPSGGTFNKQLQEMVVSATGGKIVSKINVVPTNLLNYGADIGNGQTNAYNYMVLVAMGCRQENKPVIMPGQTALPIVTSENVSASIMNFRTEYIFGGPMVMQYGGAFILEFSQAA